MEGEVVIDIQIFLDGKMYAARMWPAVPRVGDDIGLALKDGEIVAKVKRVVWLRDRRSLDRCAVDLYCETGEG